MQFGNKNRLRFERIEDVTILSDFNCGLDVIRKEKRHLGIGEYIIEAVGQRALDSRFNLAGCQFLTVEAYNRGDASAVGFYSRCDFIAAEEPNPNKETLRMYKTILPLAQFDDAYDE